MEWIQETQLDRDEYYLVTGEDLHRLISHAKDIIQARYEIPPWHNPNAFRTAAQLSDFLASIKRMKIVRAGYRYMEDWNHANAKLVYGLETPERKYQAIGLSRRFIVWKMLACDCKRMMFRGEYGCGSCIRAAREDYEDEMRSNYG